MKTVYEYGSPASSSVLIQMVDDHDLDLIVDKVSLDKAYGSSRKYTDFSTSGRSVYESDLPDVLF